jgi:hypothetical protein
VAIALSVMASVLVLAAAGMCLVWICKLRGRLKTHFTTQRMIRNTVSVQVLIMNCIAFPVRQTSEQG